MGYKSKFRGEEIDARLEKMVNVTYAELKALRDEGKLIAGQMYRMTDYETTCTWENTKCAGHPFDLVLTALDNKTLDEKCSAIQSARDKDGYFANSNLAAWDVRYCLDNDKNRFDWAQQGGKFLVAYDEWNEYLAIQDGTIEINGVTYIKWSATNGWAILCTKTTTPKYGEEAIIIEIGWEDNPWTAFVNGIEERVDGKGVIYRLIDESENSVPYDFKNIMFIRPLTEGRFNAENGVATFCYTFCCIYGDTLEIADQSVKESAYCYNNIFDVYCYDNVFLTFSEAYCYSNTFGSGCYYNTFESGCYYNTFESGCYSNIFGAFCYYNTFDSGCNSNTFGYNCGSNTFEAYCSSNTFGNDCGSNTLKNGCSSNIFGNSCSSNTFGYNCSSNTFKNNCNSNIFGEECNSNTFEEKCNSNTFGYKCKSNTFVYTCKSNTLGDSVQYVTLINSESSGDVQYYTLSNLKGTSSARKKVNVQRKREYQTFVTTKTDGTVVEYTVDNILNA